MSKKMTLMVALKGAFGYKPGEGLKEFAKEVRTLTVGDKEDFKKMFLTERDIEIVPAVNNAG